MLVPGLHGKKKKRPCGSLNYAASEIVRNKSYTGPEVDIFSLGGVLYTMLTGRLPFGNNTSKTTVQRVITGNWKVDYNLDPNVIKFLHRMFEPIAIKRATMLDVIQFVKKQKEKYGLIKIPCSSKSSIKIIEQKDVKMIEQTNNNNIQELVKLTSSSRAFVYTTCAQEENEKSNLLLREAEVNQSTILPIVENL